GFLGVEVDHPTLTLKDGVELRFDLHDTDGTGFIRPLDLTSAAPGTLFTVEVHSPGTPGPDVTFAADLNVRAEVAGLNLDLASTPITLTWDTIGGNVFNVTAGGDGGTDLLSFLKLDPAALLAKFQELKDDLVTLTNAVNVDVPFLNLNFNGLLDVASSIDTHFLSHLSLHGAEPSFETAQGLVEGLPGSPTHLQAVTG